MKKAFAIVAVLAAITLMTACRGKDQPAEH